MARLMERYKAEIAPKLREEFSLSNVMMTPKLTKVVISMGVGQAAEEKGRMAAATADLATISGQKAEIRRAQKSVSNFKLRKGMDIGCRVTLRGKRMYEFVDRLVNAAIPRLRDFRGLDPRSFDGRGNFSMGISDQSIFPEINLDKMAFTQGMNVTFVTTARRDAQARSLLRMLGVPLRETVGEAD